MSLSFGTVWIEMVEDASDDMAQASHCPSGRCGLKYVNTSPLVLGLEVTVLRDGVD